VERKGTADVIRYCGLNIYGNGSPDEPELAYELLRAAHGSGGVLLLSVLRKRLSAAGRLPPGSRMSANSCTVMSFPPFDEPGWPCCL
jgi:hypothetical protein